MRNKTTQWKNKIQCLYQWFFNFTFIQYFSGRKTFLALAFFFIRNIRFSTYYTLLIFQVKNREDMERRTETGLVMGHAYGVTAIKKVHLGRFPFVRTDRPDHFRNENFTFNQNYPARSVKSYIACRKEMFFFSAKTLGKSLFHGQNDWSGHVPAGQLWLLESALRHLMFPLQIIDK